MDGFKPGRVPGCPTRAAAEMITNFVEGALLNHDDARRRLPRGRFRPLLTALVAA